MLAETCHCRGWREKEKKMRRFVLLTFVLLTGIMGVTGLTPAHCDDRESQAGPPLFVSFNYTPVYQFRTSLDDGGSFNVSRHYFRFGLMKPMSRSFRLGLGLKYDYEKYNFNDLATVAGATPWSTLHSPGASLPMFYEFTENWTLGFIPAIDFPGESGAALNDRFVYGGVVTLTHEFGQGLNVGLGFSLFEQLERTTFFPFLAISWQINEQFRIANPFEAGPAGPAGLELVYAPSPKWELGAGGAFRSYRFRLDDRSTVPNGIGQNDFLVTFLRIQRKLGKGFSVDLAGGALFDGKLTIRDSDGSKLASDRYDPAPLVALTFSGRF